MKTIQLYIYVNRQSLINQVSKQCIVQLSMYTTIQFCTFQPHINQVVCIENNTISSCISIVLLSLVLEYQYDFVRCYIYNYMYCKRTVRSHKYQLTVWIIKLYLWTKDIIGAIIQLFLEVWNSHGNTQSLLRTKLFVL